MICFAGTSLVSPVSTNTAYLKDGAKRGVTEVRYARRELLNLYD